MAKEEDIVLSIVAVNYKTKDFIDGLLKSIFDKRSGFYDQVSEVIVLDNGSDDGVGVLVKKKYPKTHFIQNDVNTGFSGGYNKAIKQARGKYVLVLNSDIEVRTRSLGEMVKLAKAYPNSVLAGKLWFPDGVVQDSCFYLPTVFGAISEYFLGKKGRYFMFAPSGDLPVKVEGSVAACWLLPRTVIDQVGLFDEGTFLYFEDIEYCRRLKWLNIAMYYCPTAEFTHFHGMASKAMGKEKSYEYLKKGSAHYHGRLTYALLWITLWLGQRFGNVETPMSRWKKD